MPPSADAVVVTDVPAPPADTVVAQASPEQTAATDRSPGPVTGSPDPAGSTEPAADRAVLSGPTEPTTRPHPASPPVTVVVPEFASTALTELPEDRYFNREVSWLDFNARVLALAEDPRLPLLERMKFMAIFASNLDEFFMVRIAGLRRRLETGLPTRGADRLPPRAQLEMVSERTAELVADHAAEFTKVIRPALAKAGIHILGWTDLEHAEREQMRVYFREHVFPVLTPLAFDPSHPFPYISGLSLNLAAVVREPETGQELFARVKVPNNVPRFVRIEQAGRTTAEGRNTYRFLAIEELIANELGQLFSGMEVVERHAFRVTRNAEVEIDEDRDEDLLQAMERELMRRRFGPPVRLEVAADISDHVLQTLVTELEVDSRDVLRVPGPLDLSGLMQLYDCDRPDLKDPPFVPATHARLREGESTRSMFNILRDGDILVHHPYHSFSTSVQRFIEHAAADPHVLAIKQTLYRTSGDSPIVDALIAAAEAGKQVVVLVEVKARFDEKANIGWARMLERAGCHVVYGLIGLKTHCKTALVVREEGGQIRRYCHVGTGNYHPKTARLYEDFGLLTADPEVGADLTDLFNTLTGYSRQTAYRRLMVAPHGIRAGIIERIEREAGFAREGRPALVQIKVNSLVDEQVIDALYRASQAGVHIDLLIRGMCALKPGVPGLSDNIRVRSILGRFLEHSRLFRFGNGDVTAGRGRAEFWIGSADMMHRNLDRRVEALIQVTDQPSRTELAELLNASMSDRIEAFDLNPDGTWTRHISTSDHPRVDLQASLLERMLKR
ncbi:RNA degradosome polyphosphate kinase [Catellatospora paridis]